MRGRANEDYIKQTHMVQSNNRKRSAVDTRELCLLKYREALQGKISPEQGKALRGSLTREVERYYFTCGDTLFSSLGTRRVE